MLDRRRFLKVGMGSVGAMASASAGLNGETSGNSIALGASPQELDAELTKIIDAPVLDLSSLPDPVVIESIELLKSGKSYLLRTRSKSGLEVITVPHQSKIRTLYPILLGSVVPVFVGRDALDLETLLWDVYRHADNYKMQGLAFWVCVAAVEMGVLELLSHAAGKPLAHLFGGTKKRDIGVYFASGTRGNKPEEEIEALQKMVADSGAKALKFRLGGRMSRNADSLPGRSEKLIELARKTFGDSMTLYADSNSSYDTGEAIRIGRIMEDHGYGFFEEPCEFDDLWSTKSVADALTIPVAGGEQEFSMHRWKWTIANRGVDIVQPDLHYGGGFLRAVKVARMAAHVGMTVVPHMSGGGLGYVEVVQFASFVPNIGPFMEFKGNTPLPVQCDSSSLRSEKGIVQCPNGIGFGITIDPTFVRKTAVVTLWS
ncbi:MAG: mandelate racemase/muconate lactonizing enzyme family protein [Planctomycetes bacterium]|nr:mandelate racemase/muconate lactonizing enzyme family protein [Planctomycetota bacterium]